MDAISFEIKEKIAVIGKESPRGFTKELRYIAWNGRDPKYDIRDWNKEGKMTKGVTLTAYECLNLLEALQTKETNLLQEAEAENLGEEN